MDWFSRVFGGHGRNWVRQWEPVALRVVSLIFSFGSAYAVRWFLEPLDVSDKGQFIVSWAVAIGFGVLGFFVSRGLAHRMMNKEPIWVYAPLFVLVEFFEILCNYSKAASVVLSAAWLGHVPLAQQAVLVVLTYVGLSILPLISPAMAAVDMDLERRQSKSSLKSASSAPYQQQVWQQQPQRGATASYQQGYSAAQTQGAGSAAPKPQQNSTVNNSPFEGVRRP